MTLEQIRELISQEFPQLHERQLASRSSWWLDEDDARSGSLRILGAELDGRRIKWAQTALKENDKRYHRFDGTRDALKDRILEEIELFRTRQGTGWALSPSRFRRAFNRFQVIHRKECGYDLELFSDRDSFAAGFEGYKNRVAVLAQDKLDAGSWREKDISTGAILEKVISAIQIPDNNLMQWQARHGPGSEAHAALLRARSEKAGVSELEDLFFRLYHQHETTQTIFDGLMGLCRPQRYELFAYLFFVANPHVFLPIRTQSFDRVLAELGVNHRTEGRCSWENYQQFLAAMRAVQTCLRAEGIIDTSLLDAHSFCWILSQFDPPASKAAAPIVEMKPFTGSFRPAFPAETITPREDAEVRDMRREAERKSASGQIAEEIALDEERNRLRREGRADLAAMVRPVGDRPGMGFDIESFDSDGTPRFIEVKNVSKGARFFLSHWQWMNSRARKNFWFYLVSGVDLDRRTVTCLPSSQLEERHLEPVEYLVKFVP